MLRAADISLPKLSSDGPIEFDQERQRLIARGQAELTHKDLLIEAGEIDFLQSEQVIEARKDVRLTKEALRLVADRTVYRVMKRHFSTGPFRLGSYPLYIKGDSLQGTPSQIDITRSIFYFNEPDPFALNIKSRSVRYLPEERVTLKQALFRIGNVPFFYLPHYEQKTEESSLRMKAEAGYRGNLGAYLKTHTLFTLREGIKAGGNLDYYTKRGVLLGPAFEYNLSPKEGHTLQGRFDSGYIDDHGDKEEDVLDKAVPEERGFIEWKHKQKIGELVDVTGRVSYWSDSEVERDFRRDLFRHNQEPDSFLEAVHAGSNFFVSVFGRFGPHNFQTVNERLPEIRVDVMPTPIGQTRIYQRLSAAYARLKQKDTASDGTDPQSDRFNVHYQLLHPINLTPWLTVTPIAGVQITSYADDVADLDDEIDHDYTHFVGELGFDAQAKAAATWDYKQKLWDIDGLRHIVRPILRYRYIPQADQGQGKIPQVDTEVFSTERPLIDLKDIRHRDELQEYHLVRLGFENELQTRHQSGYGSRQLAQFNIYHDIRFSRADDQRTFSDLYTHLKLRPVHWLRFDLFSRFDPETLTLGEIRTRSTLLDGDIWSLSLTTENLNHQIGQYVLDFDYKFTERRRFNIQLRYDSLLDSFTENRYRLTTYLGNSWRVDFELTLNDGSSREDQAELGIRFRLLTP